MADRCPDCGEVVPFPRELWDQAHACPAHEVRRRVGRRSDYQRSLPPRGFLYIVSTPEPIVEQRQSYRYPIDGAGNDPFPEFRSGEQLLERHPLYLTGEDAFIIRGFERNRETALRKMRRHRRRHADHDRQTD